MLDLPGIKSKWWTKCLQTEPPPVNMFLMKQSAPKINAMFGTSSGAAGVHNRRVVIDAIRVNGALSRAALARATKLAKQTLSNIIEDLEREGLVLAQDAVMEGRGKPAIPYALAPLGAFSVGLQIDRHVARCVIVNLVGEVVARNDVPVSTSAPEAGLVELVQLIQRTRRELEGRHPEAGERIVGMGVAMPGPFGPRNDFSNQEYTMAFWQNFPLVARLEEATGLAVNLQNDAAAAAMAEKLTGQAHGKQNAVCIYLGYGLGAGLIINGELYDGTRCNAGEIGSVGLNPGKLTPDILERVVSLGGFCEEFGLDHAAPDVTARIQKLLQQKRPDVEAWLDQSAGYLAWITNIMQLALDPQVCVLCGTAPKEMIETLVARINLALRAGRDRRLLVGLSDPWTVALGAAAEPISRSFDPKYAALLKA